MRLTMASTGALALGIACATLSASGATEETLQKSFVATNGGRMVLDVNGGSIEVKAAERNDVRIEVHRKATARGFFGNGDEERAELEANKVSFAQEGKQVSVKARRDKNAPRRSRVSLNSHYSILVPREFDLDLKTGGGTIRVDGLHGDLKAHTSGGSLRFSSVSGLIDGHTSGGSIEMTETEGNTTVKTSGGSIRIRQHKGDLQARTSGGSVEVDRIEGNVQALSSGGSVSATLAKAPTGECRLETSGGAVTLRLPETASVNLDAKTSGGSVSSELPVHSTGEKKRSALKGTINQGGQAVFLRTSGGSIHVKKS